MNVTNGISEKSRFQIRAYVLLISCLLHSSAFISQTVYWQKIILTSLYGHSIPCWSLESPDYNVCSIFLQAWKELSLWGDIDHLQKSTSTAIKASKPPLMLFSSLEFDSLFQFIGLQMVGDTFLTMADHKLLYINVEFSHVSTHFWHTYNKTTMRSLSEYCEKWNCMILTKFFPEKLSGGQKERLKNQWIALPEEQKLENL